MKRSIPRDTLRLGMVALILLTLLISLLTSLPVTAQGSYTVMVAVGGDLPSALSTNVYVNGTQVATVAGGGSATLGPYNINTTQTVSVDSAVVAGDSERYVVVSQNPQTAAPSTSLTFNYRGQFKVAFRTEGLPSGVALTLTVSSVSYSVKAPDLFKTDFLDKGSSISFDISPKRFTSGLIIYEFDHWEKLADQIIASPQLVSKAETFSAVYNSIQQDFTLTASPSSVTVGIGQTATASITVASQNEFSAAVSLTPSGVPADITVTPEPPLITPPANGQVFSKLTVTVSRAATAGTYTITVNGASGGLTHTATLTVVIPSPTLFVSLVGPVSGAQVASAPIELKAQVTVERLPYSGATVNFFVDGVLVGSGTTDTTGHATFNFMPKDFERSYTWFVTVERVSFISATSASWAFSYRATFNVVVDGSPRVSAITVDGVVCQPTELPKTFEWLVNSGHTVSVVGKVIPSEAGQGHVFSKWEDGGTEPSRTITVGGPTTYTAIFEKVYLLEVEVEPQSLPVAVGLSPEPLEGVGRGGWYVSGVGVKVAAKPATGYTFSNWVVDGAAAKLGLTDITVTMDKPHRLTASYFRPQPLLVISSLQIPPSALAGSQYEAFVTVAYSFSLPTKVRVAIFNHQTLTELTSVGDTLVGEGAQTYSFSLKAENQQKQVKLLVRASYLEGDQEKVNAGGEYLLVLNILPGGEGVTSKRVLPLYFLIDYGGQKYKAFLVEDLEAPAAPENPNDASAILDWETSSHAWLVLNPQNSLVQSLEDYSNIAFAAEVAYRATSTWLPQNLKSRAQMYESLTGYSNIIEASSKMRAVSAGMVRGTVDAVAPELSATKLLFVEKLLEGAGRGFSSPDELIKFTGLRNLQDGSLHLSTAANIGAAPSKEAGRDFPSIPKPLAEVSFEDMARFYGEIRAGDIQAFSSMVLISSMERQAIRAQLDDFIRLAVAKASTEKPENLVAELASRQNVNPDLKAFLQQLERQESYYKTFEDKFRANAQTFAKSLMEEPKIVVALKPEAPRVYLQLYGSKGQHVGVSYETLQPEVGLQDSYYLEDSEGATVVIAPSTMGSFRLSVEARFEDAPSIYYTLTVTSLKKGLAHSSFTQRAAIRQGESKSYVGALDPSSLGIHVYSHHLQEILTPKKTFQFEVLSNSTLLNVSHSSEYRAIAVNVEGPPNTVGFLNVTLPPELLSLYGSSPARIAVYVDKQRAAPTVLSSSEGDVVTVVYSHSSREVVVYYAAYDIYADVRDYLSIPVLDANVTAIMMSSPGVNAGEVFTSSQPNTFMKLVPGTYAVVVDYRGQELTRTVQLLQGHTTIAFTVFLSNFTIAVMALIAILGSFGFLSWRRHASLKAGGLKAWFKLPPRMPLRMFSPTRFRRGFKAPSVEAPSVPTLREEAPKPPLPQPIVRLRRSYMRLSGPVIVGAAAAGTYFLIPFYPLPLAAALAVFLAALSVRRFDYGLFGVFFTSAFAYGFQFSSLIGGSWGLSIFLWFIVLSIVVFELSRDLSGLIGCGMGLVAGLMMLTPYYVLAVPVIIVLASALTLKGRVGSIITYLSVYLPLLTLNAVQKGSLQPEVYSHATQSLTGSFDLTNLGGVISLFNTSMSVDVPVDPQLVFGGLFLTGFSGVVFAATIIATLATPSAIGGAIRLLHAGGLELKSLRSLVHLPSSIAGLTVFIAALTALQEPFKYVTAASGLFEVSAQFAFTASAALLASWFLLSLQRKEHLILLQVELKELGGRLKENVSAAQRLIHSIASTCGGISLDAELSEAAKIQHEADLALRTLEGLGINLLAKKLELLRGYEGQAARLVEEAKRRLVDFCLEAVGRRRESLNLAAEFGVSLPQPPSIPPRDEVESKGVDGVLRYYQSLEEELSEVAASVYSFAEKAYSCIKTHVDRHIRITPINMAEKFMGQREFEEALEASIQALKQMSEKYSKACVNLLNSLIATAENLSRTINQQVVPVLEEAGAVNLPSRLEGLIKALEGIPKAAALTGRLKDVQLIPELKGLLSQVAIEVVTIIIEEVERVEADIQRRVPLTFDWGRNTGASASARRVIDDVSRSRDSVGAALIDAVSRGLRAALSLLETLEEYTLTQHIVMDYPQVEPLITHKLNSKGSLKAKELPLRFPERYFKLYAALHAEAYYDGEAKTLILGKRNKVG